MKKQKFLISILLCIVLSACTTFFNEDSSRKQIDTYELVENNKIIELICAEKTDCIKTICPDLNKCLLIIALSHPVKNIQNVMAVIHRYFLPKKVSESVLNTKSWNGKSDFGFPKIVISDMAIRGRPEYQYWLISSSGTSSKSSLRWKPYLIQLIVPQIVIAAVYPVVGCLL